MALFLAYLDTRLEFGFAHSLIAIAGHLQKKFETADSVEAEYSDGTREVVELVADSLYPDFSVYKGSKGPLDFLHASSPDEGQDAFVFRFPSADATIPLLSTGVVSHTGLTRTISAPADVGRNGGPCMNCCGQFFGLVTGGESETTTSSVFKN